MTVAPGINNRLDLLELAEAWRNEGRRFALATVAETWGSAPRPVGSHLIVDTEGNFEGSVSGGCVEGEVISEAEQVIADGKPRLLSFGVADETAWRVGLSCGGRISVLVQTMGDVPGSAGPLLEPINTVRRQRERVALMTDVDTGQSEIVRDADIGAQGAIAEQLGDGISGLAELPSGRVMVTSYAPPPRLVLLGAVHIAQALAPMADAAGFEVVVIDPRSAFAAPQRLPGIRVFAGWPQDVLAEIGLDPFTAFAALTHDPKIDDPGIEAALAADCFYVGALGSSKTHARRLERLRARGLDEEALARIRAPIGLAIGARSPAEIAVAVLAEMIQAKAAPKPAIAETTS
jgi:xanthine dehydrogenase accessory factor